LAFLLVKDDVIKIFFDSAGDLAKQLIAVAIGILGLSITFLKDVVRRSKGPTLAVATFLDHLLALRNLWVLDFDRRNWIHRAPATEQ
jgi:hypothetical protein